MTRLEAKRAYSSILLIRFLSAFLIFYFPIVTILAQFLLDAIDGEYASKKVLSNRSYELIDKIFDTYWYLILLFYLYLTIPEYFQIVLLLFVYRLVGVVLYMIHDERKYLFYFANLFQGPACLLIIINSWPQLEFLITSWYFIYFVIGFILSKFAQEYFLHVKKASFIEVVFHKKKCWGKD